jgi:hypothetical protein
MKILAVASAVDLDFRYGCTPAWWQLWKGLYEEGVDLVVTPTAAGPSSRPGGARRRTRRSSRASRSPARATSSLVKGDAMLRRAEDNPEDGFGDRMTREVVWRWVTPRWRRHLDALVSASGPTRLSSSRCRWRTCAGSRPTCASATAYRSCSTTATRR